METATPRQIIHRYIELFDARRVLGTRECAAAERYTEDMDLIMDLLPLPDQAALMKWAQAQETCR